MSEPVEPVSLAGQNPGELLANFASFLRDAQQQTAEALKLVEAQAAEIHKLCSVLSKPSPLAHPAARPSFSIEEACQYLGIGRTALKELMATRQIGFHQTAERGKVHFTQRQLDAWRDRHEFAPTKAL